MQQHLGAAHKCSSTCGQATQHAQVAGAAAAAGVQRAKAIDQQQLHQAGAGAGA